eukprot:symbB.v1.2.009851.t1/scaffold637.1/size178048/2
MDASHHPMAVTLSTYLRGGCGPEEDEDEDEKLSPTWVTWQPHIGCLDFSGAPEVEKQQGGLTTLPLAGSGERFAMPLALGCLCQRQLASDHSGSKAGPGFSRSGATAGLIQATAVCLARGLGAPWQSLRRSRVPRGREGIFFAAFRSVGFQRCLATGVGQCGMGMRQSYQRRRSMS